MKENLFLEKKSFFPYWSDESAWKKFLGEKKFSDASVNLQVAFWKEGSLQWSREGSLKDALELSLRSWSPSGGDPGDLLRRRWMRDWLVQLRSLQLGPLVWVDVFGDAAFGLSHLVDFVIQPDMKKLDAWNGSKKARCIFHGKKATLEALHHLRSLVSETQEESRAP